MQILDSEKAVIGAILMNQDILPRIRSRIKPTDFAGEKNRAVYTAMVSLAGQGIPLEPDTVLGEITGGKEDQAARDHLISIIEDVGTSAGWEYHVSRMLEAETRKRILQIADMIRGSLKDKSSAKEILSSLKSAIGKIDQDVSAGKTVSLADALPGVIDSLELGAVKPGTPSGFYDIDNITGGWQNGELVVIAGRPGMGKSLIAKDFAEHAKTPVLYFSLEMSKAELIKRQISGISRVDFECIRTSKIPVDEWDSVIRAADKLSKIPIFYNDSGNLGIDELCAIAETGKLMDNIGLVVIDYLQLIKSEERVEAREREVANISRKLKGLARNLDIPVICLAQLNRQCEARKPPRPVISDLRESGAIEQDADIVGFLYRPWVYDKTADQHEAEFIIAKSRNTRTGIIKMVFDGNNQIFRSAAREDKCER